MPRDGERSIAHKASAKATATASAGMKRFRGLNTEDPGTGTTGASIRREMATWNRRRLGDAAHGAADCLKV